MCIQSRAGAVIPEVKDHGILPVGRCPPVARGQVITDRNQQRIV
jgi:hypothetical protein